MRLIDADKLIETVAEKMWNELVHWGDVKGIINEQPTVNEWIPVTERLPKNSEYDWVLAQVQEDNGFLWIPRVMEYRENKNDWFEECVGWLNKDHNGVFKVIAWMPPIPEYKERYE